MLFIRLRFIYELLPLVAAFDVFFLRGAFWKGLRTLSLRLRVCHRRDIIERLSFSLIFLNAVQAKKKCQLFEFQWLHYLVLYTFFLKNQHYFFRQLFFSSKVSRKNDLALLKLQTSPHVAHSRPWFLSAASLFAAHWQFPYSSTRWISIPSVLVVSFEWVDCLHLSLREPRNQSLRRRSDPPFELAMERRVSLVTHQKMRHSRCQKCSFPCLFASFSLVYSKCSSFELVPQMHDLGRLRMHFYSCS